jgi:hypothetical protein
MHHVVNCSVKLNDLNNNIPKAATSPNILCGHSPNSEKSFPLLPLMPLCKSAPVTHHSSLHSYLPTPFLESLFLFAIADRALTRRCVAPCQGVSLFPPMPGIADRSVLRISNCCLPRLKNSCYRVMDDIYSFICLSEIALLPFGSVNDHLINGCLLYYF